jgi:hypothetical protein
MIRRYVQMADCAFRLRSLSCGGRGRLQSAYELDQLISDRDDLSCRIKIVAEGAPAFQTNLN